MSRAAEKSEARVLAEVRTALGEIPELRLFRNQVGRAWFTTQFVQHENGNVTLINPRMVSTGLVEGSADLIGWCQRTITASDVGKRVAVFTSLEIKSSTGRLAANQKQWMNVVNLFGGIAGVANSIEQARKVISSPLI